MKVVKQDIYTERSRNESKFHFPEFQDEWFERCLVVSEHLIF